VELLLHIQLEKVKAVASRQTVTGLYKYVLEQAKRNYRLKKDLQS